MSCQIVLIQFKKSRDTRFRKLDQFDKNIDLIFIINVKYVKQ